MSKADDTWRITAGGREHVAPLTAPTARETSMHLTDRERQVIAALERQFDPAPATVDRPASTVTAASASDRPGRARRACRLAGPAGLLGAVLLSAGLVLTVLSSTLLGAALVGWWLIVRHGHRLTAAAGFLVEAGETAAAANPGYSPSPWWLACGGRF